jgi:hypothetical protein
MFCTGKQYGIANGKALTGYNIQPVRYYEYPNVVCIAGFTERILEENTWCTGTIISYSHILTSEHCLNNVENEPYRLICGSNNLYRGISYYPAWWTSYDQWCRFQNFQIQYLINDIALIKVIILL